MKLYAAAKNREGDSAQPARCRRCVIADYAPLGGSNLTRRQKTMLVLLAKEAARAAGEPDSGQAFDAWRHEESVRAAGVRISSATQRHWGSLRAHFENLCGRSDKAIRVLLRDQDNDRRVARWKLDRALEKAGIDQAYAEHICRTACRVPLDQATAAQLWHIHYTVRNRSAARRRKGAA